MALKALGTAGHRGGRRRHLISVKHSSPSRRDVRYSLLLLRVEVSLSWRGYFYFFIFSYSYCLFSASKNIKGVGIYERIIKLEFC